MSKTKTIILDSPEDPFKEERKSMTYGPGEIPCITQIQPGMSITSLELPAEMDLFLWKNFVHSLYLANGVVIIRSAGQQTWEKDKYMAVQDLWAEVCEIVDARPMFIINVATGDVRSIPVCLAALSTISLATPEATFGFPDARVGGMPAVPTTMMRKRCTDPSIRKMVMTTTPIDAYEAQRMGLVDFVGDVEAEVARLIYRNCQPKTVYYMWKKDVEKKEAEKGA
mmetsp:Transcript_82230/g.142895  ORF Transcript_82230/g.142895 Transcript_82230/m.142895 type:complete len:225 (-) Transcript_82230:116-790(-)